MANNHKGAGTGTWGRRERCEVFYLTDRKNRVFSVLHIGDGPGLLLARCGCEGEFLRLRARCLAPVWHPSGTCRTLPPEGPAIQSPQAPHPSHINPIAGASESLTMPRNREFLTVPNIIVHVWNEGVRQEKIFHTKSQYQLFLDLLGKVQPLTDVSVLLYSLIPDRFDLVLHQHRPYAISTFMKLVCNTYSCLVNQSMKKRGHSFLKRYGGTPLTSAGQLLRISYSVHTNPVEAGLISYCHAWPYSSCRGYLDHSRSSLVDHSLLWDLVGGVDQYRKFMEHFRPSEMGSEQDFLSPDSPTIWANKERKKRRHK